ncbi:MAG: type IV pilus assembly protein PilX [Colwellia sp.]|jgi:Tfp pilus assembly protein PilX|uniref:pilus assembly PilX family protein n=1 Tax=unclassified Colwellia TaxID=196834 RepID=UPI0015F635FF|nr:MULTISPECIES: pilus assembly PilX N-terminal domain-containing protein [unclassified Colwellia]MBA6253689.1 pilus assembly PilX N-terminal domain-containing protein [Colwellia sp. MB3u-55]MBA6396599.1 pilus assembly PilX N-terminal domain-containing protein [Colwellia sp. BRX10-4]
MAIKVIRNRCLIYSGNLKLGHKQSGVVLIVSLVFLIALTAVAAALMQNTTIDMKMSGASEEKVVATQEAVSAIDEVIYKEVTQISGTNAFASEIAKFPLSPVVSSASNTSAEITLANPYKIAADCPHSRAASSVQVFKCNVLKVQVTRLYGRTNKSTIEVNSGVSQQLLNVGN